MNENPRLVEQEKIHLVGIERQYSEETRIDIPLQWQDFFTGFGTISGRKGNAAYGVVQTGPEKGEITYLTGVEIAPENANDVSSTLTSLIIPAAKYAVFLHSGHVSEINQTWQAIFSEWLPSSGLTPLPSPMFERYGEGFDPQSGLGDMEIWVPIKND